MKILSPSSSHHPSTSFTKTLVRGLEMFRIAPAGSKRIAEVLVKKKKDEDICFFFDSHNSSSPFKNLGADRLVEAGKLQIFTPMFYFKVRKPLNA